MARLAGIVVEGEGTNASLVATKNAGRPQDDTTIVKQLEDDVDRLLDPQRHGSKPHAVAQTSEIQGLC